jgi:hypothetical protein
MDALRFYETPAIIYHLTRRGIPDELNLREHHCQNPKSWIVFVSSSLDSSELFISPFKKMLLKLWHELPVFVSAEVSEHWKREIKDRKVGILSRIQSFVQPKIDREVNPV